MQELARFVRGVGFRLPRTPDRWEIQNLLAAVKGKDGSFAVNMVVLRSFEKAQYSPLNVGHFALASTHYCHFTSPIRRYADLLVHRVLQCYLQHNLNSADHNVILPKEDLIEIGKYITFTEQRAEDAEGELRTVLILQMLSNHLGDELDGVVTGLTNFGVFVRSKKFGIEGLVRTEDLGPDDWKYDSKTYSIVGLNTGKVICLGMPMKVRIISVNVPTRQLSIAPVKPLVDLTGLRKKDKFSRRSEKHRTKRRR
jgi:ribonuclease R